MATEATSDANDGGFRTNELTYLKKSVAIVLALDSCAALTPALPEGEGENAVPGGLCSVSNLPWIDPNRKSKAPESRPSRASWQLFHDVRFDGGCVLVVNPPAWFPANKQA